VSPPRPSAPTPTPHGNGEFYATRDAYAPWDRSSGFYPSPGGTEDAYRSTWDTFFTNFDRANGFHSSGKNTYSQPSRDGHTKPDAATRERTVKDQQAEAVLARGRVQAEGLKAQGEQQSEDILAAALKTVTDLKANAIERAQAIKDRAEAKAAADRARIERDLDAARQQVKAIQLEFVDEMNRIDKEAEAKAKAVRTHANNAAGVVMQTAVNEAHRLRK
jgi:hypothetical protein